jgi:hypothetical protein
MAAQAIAAPLRSGLGRYCLKRASREIRDELMIAEAGERGRVGAWGSAFG